MSAKSSKEQFDEFALLFNDAIKEKNATGVEYLGEELIKIADRECSRSNINEQMKKYFTDGKNKVKIHLENIKKHNFNSTTGASSAIKIKWFSDEVPNLNLNDVKGLEDVISEFLVNVLAPASPKYAPIYKKYRGSKFGTQILLYGPPGTGKTFIVKCLAGHLGCHIAVVQTKDILANLVGDAEKNMSAVFEEARKYKKCIIFFDEIDAIAANRDDDESRHTKGVLTTMLTYMDGFTDGVKDGQLRIIIAATNRPWILDSAIKRGGRFETQIYVPLPDTEAREQLVKIAFGKDENISDRVDIPCASDFSIEWLAEKLEGMAGADILAVCKQIINKPLQREIEALYYDNVSANEFVTRQDCETVIGKYINGVTDEMLMQFGAYSAGLDYKDYAKIISKNK